MNTPGFTAEVSLSQTTEYYRTNKSFGSSMSQEVMPQQIEKLSYACGSHACGCMGTPDCVDMIQSGACDGAYVTVCYSWGCFCKFD
jgi:hypothetical protein